MPGWELSEGKRAGNNKGKTRERKEGREGGREEERKREREGKTVNSWKFVLQANFCARNMPNTSQISKVP